MCRLIVHQRDNWGFNVISSLLHLVGIFVSVSWLFTGEKGHLFSLCSLMFLKPVLIPQSLVSLIKYVLSIWYCHLFFFSYRFLTPTFPLCLLSVLYFPLSFSSYLLICFPSYIPLLSPSISPSLPLLLPDPKRAPASASRAGSRAGSRASSRRGSDASDASELQDTRSVCSDTSDTPRRPGGGAKPSKIPTISKKAPSPKTPGSGKK